MIAAPESNSGKTIVAVGIIRALKNRGMDVSAFKTGPDFVDRKYIELASKKQAGNLDLHMMGEEGLNDAIAMNNGELAVIEGVMGYFDGIYNTYKNSSYDISKKLDISTILVYAPKGEMFTMIPKVKGMVDFSKNRIKGIILNKTSKAMYMLLKEQIEKQMDVKVLGYIPYEDSMKIDHRSLGLLQPDEIEEIDHRMNNIANIVEETVNIDEIINMTEEIKVKSFQYPAKTKLSVAIAYDEAFNFYYQENLNLLKHITRVKYFSPLKDEQVPEADLIYIGGGYPELFKDELSSNKTMIKSLRNHANNDGYIYGAGGGLIYLSNSIDGIPMCKIIDGASIMTERLQNFGYSNITLEEYIIPAQEFHRSILETDMDQVFSLTKPMSDKSWKSGYRYKNTIGIFQHINFLGNMKLFNHLIQKLEDEKEKSYVY